LEDLKKLLENDDDDVNWIVVRSYGPPYTSPSEHPVFTSLRILVIIFDKYNVGLVFSGHNHNYQRTYIVTFNPDE
jgi:acid phosphatase type 7